MAELEFEHRQSVSRTCSIYTILPPTVISCIYYNTFQLHVYIQPSQRHWLWENHASICSSMPSTQKALKRSLSEGLKETAPSHCAPPVQPLLTSGLHHWSSPLTGLPSSTFYYLFPSHSNQQYLSKAHLWLCSSLLKNLEELNTFYRIKSPTLLACHAMPFMT